MWSWAPIAASIITSMVAILIALGGYFGGRRADGWDLDRRFARAEGSATSEGRRIDDRLTRVDAELAAISRQMVDFMARLVALERESKYRFDDIREAHGRLEQRLDEIFTFLRKASGAM